MCTLHEVGRRVCHVVTKVVEAKLVVCTESDVGHVGSATLGRVGTMLVNAIDRQTVEHVERSHPLRVTLCKVVVYGNDVNAVACKGVEEHRQGCHKGLALTCCHLSNLALMQGDTSKDLHVIVDHLPFQVVSACCPMVAIYGLVAVNIDKVVLGVGCQLTVEVGGCNHGLLVLGKAACCVFHDAEGNRHNLVESLLIDLKRFFLQLVDLAENAFALVDGRFFNLAFQISNLLLLLVGRVLHIFLYLLCLGTQFVVA